MEPKILLVGRNLSTLEILKDELIKFDRNIFIANSKETIESCLNNENIDLISVGAGLPDDMRDSLLAFIKNIAPNIELHVMQKEPGMTPVSQIWFTNEKAIMWKMMSARRS
jgi:hypothetical protein